MSSSRSTKKFYVENLGCAKNQVDAESMISSFPKEEWLYTEDSQEADLIVVNTCGFITAAKEESINTFLELRQNYPDKKIIVAGCMAQRYQEKLAELLPDSDGIFGNEAPSQIMKVLPEVMAGENPMYFPAKEEHQPLRDYFINFDKAVYVKVSEGCNHRCSFCAIPLIRGSLNSRPIQDILFEIKDLVQKGVAEINLVAQDLVSYGKDKGGVSQFLTLLDQISEIHGKFWLRLLYIHPDQFLPEILERCRKDERILPYFDLPFQHASIPVLRAMGRRGTPESYLDIIKTIRESRPDAIVRSTFLVGFPKEKDSDFNALLDFQEKAKIDWLGIFTYSREEGTASYRMYNPLTAKSLAKKAEKRKTILEERQASISEKRLDRFVGTTMEVLIEEEVQGEDLYLARGPIHAPEVDGLVVLHGTNLEVGAFCHCKIIKRNGIDLEARLL